MIMTFTSFDYFLWWTGSILIVVSLLVVELLLYFRNRRLSPDNYELLEDNTNFSYYWIVAFVVSVSVIFFCNYFFSGFCFVGHPSEFTFRGTRLFEPDLCEQSGDKPCLVYLTMGNTTNKIIVHYHMSKKLDNTFVYFDKNPHRNVSQYSNRVVPEIYHLKEVDFITNRYIYYAFLFDLEPNTRYYFAIGAETHFLESNELNRSFKTGPENSNFTFITAGDAGISDLFATLLTQSSKREPLFAAIGGDIGYHNGIPACYRRMDKWAEYWMNRMITPSGLMVPIIASIGNHEVGGMAKSNNHNPFFSNFFVHEELKGKEPKTLSTYRKHQLSPTAALLVLDSYIVAPPGGDQKEWIRKTTRHLNGTTIMTIYHAGLYPSSRDPSDEPHVSLRNEWGDLFDNYVKVSFENHDHAYKRTYPLKKGFPSLNGTIYLGDGAFGVDVTKNLRKVDYIEKSLSKSFFFHVDFGIEDINISSIDEKGTIFDQFTIKR